VRILEDEDQMEAAMMSRPQRSKKIGTLAPIGQRSNRIAIKSGISTLKRPGQIEPLNPRSTKNKSPKRIQLGKTTLGGEQKKQTQAQNGDSMSFNEWTQRVSSTDGWLQKE
jgi:hypothetical protein